MTFRLAQANVCEPDDAGETRETIETVAAHADVATFNECTEASTHATLHALRGWQVHTPPHGSPRENCIGWRHPDFRCLHRGATVVMRGGTVGRRRRGPSRSVTWVLLEEQATGRRFVLATHHAIARADTRGFRWRLPLRAAGFKGVAKALAKVMADYDAPLILTGDLNTVGRVRFAGLGLREIRTPGTFGHKRYDRILAAPGIRVRDVRTLPTRSDHLALTALVTLEKP